MQCIYVYQRDLLRKCFKSIGRNFEIKRPHSIVGEQYMTIGDNFFSFQGLRMECISEYHGGKYNPELKIGNDVKVHYNCHIGVINKVVIGNNVLIGSNVLITDHSHGQLEKTDIPFYQRMLLSKGPVIIGDNVWVGENACILPGVTIGEGSIVGANSVVTHNIPPYSLAVGSPAKIMKQLS